MKIIMRPDDYPPAIKNHETKRVHYGWISVEVSLPAPPQAIRVLIENKEHTAYWEPDIDRYRVGSGGVNCCYCGGWSPLKFINNERDYGQFVSHWMPLRNLPKE